VTARNRVKIASARWTFGDGSLADGTAARHRWTRAGTYKVTVSARLADGHHRVASTRVLVSTPSKADPPTITEIDIDRRPLVGQTVRFSADMVGATPQRWHWTVTDSRGGRVTSNSAPASFTHTFAKPGPYTVTLRVSLGRHRDVESRSFRVDPDAREPGPTVTCNQEVRGHFVLPSNLNCPGKPGLRVAESGVTIDLNGYGIFGGNKTNTGIWVESRDGSTLENIRIVNGTVSNFEVGVMVRNARGVSVKSVRLRDHGSSGDAGGMIIAGTRGLRLYDVTFSGGENALYAWEGASATDTEIDQSHVHDGDVQFSFGEDGAEGVGLTIKNTEFHDAGMYIGYVDGLGIDNLTMSGTNYKGLAISSTRSIDIINSTFEGLSGGVEIHAPPAGFGEGTSIKFVDNDVLDAEMTGLEVFAQPNSVGDIEITRNIFDRNGRGVPDDGWDGLYIEVGEATQYEPAYSGTITLTGNQTSRSLHSGIEVVGLLSSVRDGGDNTFKDERLGCTGFTGCKPARDGGEGGSRRGQFQSVRSS
jgi:PKD domain/Right handed beta helix region